MIFNTDKMIDVDNSTGANAVNTQFDCLINDVGINHQIIKTDQSDYMDRYLNQSVRQNNFTSLNAFQKHKANYNVKLSADYMINMNKLQFLLMAPTSPAVKVNEETLTYLNQGQNYEIKLSCNEPPHLNELQIDQNYAYQNEDIKPFINLETKSIETGFILNNHSNSTTLNQIVRDTNEHDLSDKLPRQENNTNNQNLQLDMSNQNTLVYLSVVRVCFWDRKLQEMEQDEIKEWEKEYPNMRMLEIDSNSSYGIIEVRTSDAYINAAEILWNGRTGANIFFRCNCTSTAFAPHKHGGEKGIHMRFQIDTFEVDLHNKKINYNNEMLSFNSNHNVAASAASTSITSILSPPNSTSSPNSIKFIKEDLESCNTNRQVNTPTPTNNKQWLEFSEIKHVASSFCRIQLFRLKGAQRKLKTDRSKIERLNPPDLRKRYQPSNKITILNNCSYDWLFSLLPFVKEPNQHVSEINSDIDNYQTTNSHFSTSVDYTNNSYSQANNHGFVQSQPYQNLVNGSSIEFMNNINQNQYINHYSSLDMPNQNESGFYMENSYQQINQNNLSNSMQNHDYGYNRMKRTSSFNSVGNFQNLKPNKIQKTAITSTVSSPQIFSTNFNNMSSLASSSASSSSSTSSSPSPISPIINFQHSQSVGNQQYTQIEYQNTSHSCPLLYDCTNKYVQEWLIQNRFYNLLGIFSNYTSNDVLRLSKEDMVTLCGGADGIRCYNMAHNIPIKPKLTIFVTFDEQSYYSAIYLNESKSHFLLTKLLNGFSLYVKSLKNGEEKSDKSSESEDEDDEKKFKSKKDLTTLHEKIISGNLEYEIFLKIKGALVRTTDEVLNNFEDQSKFLIEFEISELKIDPNKTMHLKSNCLPNNSINLTKNKVALLKVMLIPLD